MIRAGEHLVLSLWKPDEFEAEVGPIKGGEGLVPFTLAHNVSTPEEVDAVLATARAAGADPVSQAERRDWGLHGLLRRSRRIPLGNRLQPGPRRSDRASCHLVLT